MGGGKRFESSTAKAARRETLAKFAGNGGRYESRGETARAAFEKIVSGQAFLRSFLRQDGQAGATEAKARRALFAQTAKNAAPSPA
jgi:hypothetical protein